MINLALSLFGTEYIDNYVDFYKVNPENLTNIVGATLTIGNTVEAVTKCKRIQNISDIKNCEIAKSNNNIYYDNEYMTKFINKDKSSIAYLKLPSNAKEIVWAAVVWQGHINNYTYQKSNTNYVTDDGHDFFYYDSFDVEKINGKRYVLFRQWKTAKGMKYYEISNDLPDNLTSGIKKTDANKIKLTIDNETFDIEADKLFYKGDTRYFCKNPNRFNRRLGYYCSNNNLNRYERKKGVKYSAYKVLSQDILDKINENIDLAKTDGIPIKVSNLTSTWGLEARLGDYGAWSLVVIYKTDPKDSASILNNIDVFLGFKSLPKSDRHDMTINIGGLLLPRHGEIKSTLSIFTAEGEKSLTGDYVKVNGEKMTEDGAYEDNIFDSMLSDKIKRDPFLKNNNGIDIDIFDASAAMEKIRDKNPDAESYNAEIKVHSYPDGIFIGLITFQTQLYRPRVCYYIDTITDENRNVVFKNGKFVENAEIYPDEEYNITVWISNMKKNREDLNIEDAKKVKIFLDFHNFNYKKNSTLMKNIGWSSFRHQTDIPNDDLFTYWSDKNESNYHVGKGATASEGGEIKVTTFNNPLGKAYINFLGSFIIDNNSSYIDLSNVFKFKASFETESIKISEKDAKEIEPCVNISSVGHVGGVLGKFNIVHEHGGNSDFNDINSPQNQLYTQIVNKPFKVKIIHLNDSFDKLSSYTGDVNVTLIEDTFSDTDTDEEKQIKCNNAVPVTSWIHVKFNNENSKIVDFVYNKAIRDARFKISYVDRGKVKFSCSTDDFSIRPNKYLITSIDKKLIAGEDINIIVQALDYNNNLIRNFNFSNAPVELNITDAMGCITGNVTKPSALKINIDFINGLGKFTFNYSEVGDLNISIREYKNGNEFAKVDENDLVDSYGNVINDKVLLIGEGNSTIKRFYPDHFHITGSFKNFNDGNFTYLANDLNMSSKLIFNIAAVNKNGNITKNYNKTCYAKSTDLNISYTLPSSVPASVNKIWVLMNKSFFSVNRGNVIQKTFPKTLFEYGKADVTAYINLKRSYNTPIEEFDFVIKDINVSDVNNTFGNLYLSAPVHMKYGRIAFKGDIATYSSNTIKTVISYMYWDKVKGWVVNKDHNSSVYGDIDLNNTYVAANGVKLLKNSDLNISKNDIENGEENITIVSRIVPYSAKIHFAISSWLWYHPLAKPYKGPSVTNIDCLTHPCMKVIFIKNTKGWAGIGKENTKYNEQNTTTNVNISNKPSASKNEVKKFNW